MTWSVAADAVVITHLAYLVFVAVGGLLAWRWRALLWLHLAAVAWALGILVVGQDCPLTELQRWAEGRAGQPADGRGFVDRYVEGVVYPERFTTALRVLVGVLVLAGWVGLWVQRRRTVATQPSAPTRSTSVQPG